MSDGLMVTCGAAGLQQGTACSKAGGSRSLQSVWLCAVQMHRRLLQDGQATCQHLPEGKQAGMWGVMQTHGISCAQEEEVSYSLNTLCTVGVVLGEFFV
jgi:hypothetical protein